MVRVDQTLIFLPGGTSIEYEEVRPTELSSPLVSLNSACASVSIDSWNSAIPFLMTGQGFEGECAPFGRVGLERRKEARVRERPVVQGAPDRREGVGEPREGQQRPGRLEAAGARLLVPVCHRLDFRQERLGADRHGI